MTRTRSSLDHQLLRDTVRRTWQESILPSLSDYIRIPALSPGFDADWVQSGQLVAAVEHVRDWIAEQGLTDASLDIMQLPDRTPVLVLDVPATPGAGDVGTVLLYGHLDKQPPVGGWSEGLGPWTPVLRDGKLYGRGSVDDGYSGYAATTALTALIEAGGEHGRCVLLLETTEESGSADLPVYLEHLREQLGDVSLVVCLDAGGLDYERMWLTTSLRGLLFVNVTVRVLDAGQHSGLASGIVPSSFRVLRSLLDRLEDSATGEIKIAELNVPIPDDRVAEAHTLVAAAPGAVLGTYPFADGVRPVSDDEVELVLNGTWRPTLSIIGADGLPAPLDAGNVLRTSTTLVLSFRLPPTADPVACQEAVRRALTTDVPYGAVVELDRIGADAGWNSPPLAPWLTAAVDEASEDLFGAPRGAVGIGGSIPFMGLLGEVYPRAQFVVTGAAGPDSNPHVPDEWLHVEFATRLTEGIARILDAHARS